MNESYNLGYDIDENQFDAYDGYIKKKESKGYQSHSDISCKIGYSDSESEGVASIKDVSYFTYSNNMNNNYKKKKDILEKPVWKSLYDIEETVKDSISDYEYSKNNKLDSDIESPRFGNTSEEDDVDKMEEENETYLNNLNYNNFIKDKNETNRINNNMNISITNDRSYKNILNKNISNNLYYDFKEELKNNMYNNLNEFKNLKEDYVEATTHFLKPKTFKDMNGLYYDLNDEMIDIDLIKKEHEKLKETNELRNINNINFNHLYDNNNNNNNNKISNNNNNSLNVSTKNIRNDKKYKKEVSFANEKENHSYKKFQHKHKSLKNKKDTILKKIINYEVDELNNGKDDQMYEGEDEYSEELDDEMCEDSDNKIYYKDEKFNDMVDKKFAKDINFEWWNSKKDNKISKDINEEYEDLNDKMKSSDSHFKNNQKIVNNNNNNNNKILNRYDLPKDISYYVEEYQKRKEQAKNYDNKVENQSYIQDKNINDDKENYPSDNVNNNIRSNTTTVYANSTLSNEKNNNFLNSNISENVSILNKENNLFNLNINKSNENMTIQNYDDDNKLVDNNIYIDQEFLIKNYNVRNNKHENDSTYIDTLKNNNKIRKDIYSDNDVINTENMGIYNETNKMNEKISEQCVNNSTSNIYEYILTNNDMTNVGNENSNDILNKNIEKTNLQNDSKKIYDVYDMINDYYEKNKNEETINKIQEKCVDKVMYDFINNNIVKEKTALDMDKNHLYFDNEKIKTTYGNRDNYLEMSKKEKINIFLKYLKMIDVNSLSHLFQYFVDREKDEEMRKKLQFLLIGGDEKKQMEFMENYKSNKNTQTLDKDLKHESVQTSNEKNHIENTIQTDIKDITKTLYIKNDMINKKTSIDSVFFKNLSKDSYDIYDKNKEDIKKNGTPHTKQENIENKEDITVNESNSELYNEVQKINDLKVKILEKIKGCYDNYNSNNNYNDDVETAILMLKDKNEYNKEKYIDIYNLIDENVNILSKLNDEKNMKSNDYKKKNRSMVTVETFESLKSFEKEMNLLKSHNERLRRRIEKLYESRDRIKNEYIKMEKLKESQDRLFIATEKHIEKLHNELDNLSKKNEDMKYDLKKKNIKIVALESQIDNNLNINSNNNMEKDNKSNNNNNNNNNNSIINMDEIKKDEQIYNEFNNKLEQIKGKITNKTQVAIQLQSLQDQIYILKEEIKKMDSLKLENTQLKKKLSDMKNHNFNTFDNKEENINIYTYRNNSESVIENSNEHKFIISNENSNTNTNELKIVTSNTNNTTSNSFVTMEDNINSSENFTSNSNLYEDKINKDKYHMNNSEYSNLSLLKKENYQLYEEIFDLKEQITIMKKKNILLLSNRLNDYDMDNIKEDIKILQSESEKLYLEKIKILTKNLDEKKNKINLLNDLLKTSNNQTVQLNKKIVYILNENKQLHNKYEQCLSYLEKLKMKYDQQAQKLSNITNISYNKVPSDYYCMDDYKSLISNEQSSENLYLNSSEDNKINDLIHMEHSVKMKNEEDHVKSTEDHNHINENKINNDKDKDVNMNNENYYDNNYYKGYKESTTTCGKLSEIYSYENVKYDVYDRRENNKIDDMNIHREKIINISISNENSHKTDEMLKRLEISHNNENKNNDNNNNNNNNNENNPLSRKEQNIHNNILNNEQKYININNIFEIDNITKDLENMNNIITSNNIKSSQSNELNEHNIMKSNIDEENNTFIQKNRISNNNINHNIMNTNNNLKYNSFNTNLVSESYKNIDNISNTSTENFLRNIEKRYVSNKINELNNDISQYIDKKKEKIHNLYKNNLEYNNVLDKNTSIMNNNITKTNEYTYKNINNDKDNYHNFNKEENNLKSIFKYNNNINENDEIPKSTQNSFTNEKNIKYYNKDGNGMKLKNEDIIQERFSHNNIKTYAVNKNCSYDTYDNIVKINYDKLNDSTQTNVLNECKSNNRKAEAWIIDIKNNETYPYIKIDKKERNNEDKKNKYMYNKNDNQNINKGGNNKIKKKNNKNSNKMKYIPMSVNNKGYNKSSINSKYENNINKNKNDKLNILVNNISKLVQSKIKQELSNKNISKDILNFEITKIKKKSKKETKNMNNQNNNNNDDNNNNNGDNNNDNNNNINIINSFETINDNINSYNVLNNKVQYDNINIDEGNYINNGPIYAPDGSIIYTWVNKIDTNYMYNKYFDSKKNNINHMPLLNNVPYLNNDLLLNNVILNQNNMNNLENINTNTMGSVQPFVTFPDFYTNNLKSIYLDHNLQNNNYFENIHLLNHNNLNNNMNNINYIDQNSLTYNNINGINGNINKYNNKDIVIGIPNNISQDKITTIELDDNILKNDVNLILNNNNVVNHSVNVEMLNNIQNVNQKLYNDIQENLPITNPLYTTTTNNNNNNNNMLGGDVLNNSYLFNINSFNPNMNTYIYNNNDYNNYNNHSINYNLLDKKEITVKNDEININSVLENTNKENECNDMKNNKNYIINKEDNIKNEDNNIHKISTGQNINNTNVNVMKEKRNNKLKDDYTYKKNMKRSSSLDIKKLDSEKKNKSMNIEEGSRKMKTNTAQLFNYSENKKKGLRDMSTYADKVLEDMKSLIPLNCNGAIKKSSIHTEKKNVSVSDNSSLMYNQNNANISNKIHNNFKDNKNEDGTNLSLKNLLSKDISTNNNDIIINKSAESLPDSCDNDNNTINEKTYKSYNSLDMNNNSNISITNNLGNNIKLMRSKSVTTNNHNSLLMKNDFSNSNNFYKHNYTELNRQINNPLNHLNLNDFSNIHYHDFNFQNSTNNKEFRKYSTNGYNNIYNELNKNVAPDNFSFNKRDQGNYFKSETRKSLSSFREALKKEGILG
ncbi:conserved Plasmodium protein, unknown function [Plasmodium sp. gorilla clade G3]|nr:conserved Plasmodium protein, unknown function [Plasmodium sp. gorilla clade G3]